MAASVCQRNYAAEEKRRRSRGARGGKGPARNQIIAIKNVCKTDLSVLSDFLTSVARFFVKIYFHKKCGVFEACKKVTDFFDKLKNSAGFFLPSFYIGLYILRSGITAVPISGHGDVTALVSPIIAKAMTASSAMTMIAIIKPSASNWKRCNF